VAKVLEGVKEQALNSLSLLFGKYTTRKNVLLGVEVLICHWVLA
jgi:hypothetical protein